MASKVDRVIVSTESRKIAKVAKDNGAEVIMRPIELAKDDTPTLPVIQHAIESLKEKFQYVVTLQPTSPLRTKKHINEALELFRSDPQADSLVSVLEVPHNFNPNSLMNISDGYLQSFKNQEELILRRQEKETYYARNGAAIYITKWEKIEEYIFGGRIIPFFMNKLESLDIDDYEDLHLAELILKNKIFL